MLLKENQQDINELDNKRNDLHRADAVWIGKNDYLSVYELSRSFISILDKYYKSKYKEPISGIPSRKSESFANRINKIFEVWTE